MSKALCYSVLCFLLTVVNGLHLPSYVKPCALKSPDFKKCAVKHGNDAIPFLVKGDRAYGIPAFNPLRIPFVSIQAAGLHMNLTNSAFSGAETLEVVDVDINNETKYMELKVKSPLITLDFDYTVEGKIASLPITGQGHGKIDIIDAEYGYLLYFELIEKDGKTYLKPGKDKITITPKSIKTDLQNLFNGNKQLGDALNQVLNDNWKELLNEFSSTISEIYGSIARSVFEKLLEKIPMDETFTDW
ncbi:hypothetical protein WA026_003897 [Henosepilachna vigintioctopunctata]|uniref:Protein takeout-like n=1 Tax=Henosepilachna vigintioctopunctata TaxID=420089 RepID=A0AAW1UEL3_9CUCU